MAWKLDGQQTLGIAVAQFVLQFCCLAELFCGPPRWKFWTTLRAAWQRDEDESLTKEAQEPVVPSEAETWRLVLWVEKEVHKPYIHSRRVHQQNKPRKGQRGWASFKKKKKKEYSGWLI